MYLNNPKISIVLPSLNVVSYIEQCLDSVINQTLSDIEIICIDGGSTDGTFQILKKYENNDSRIKVISSDIKSYGHQMNVAISMAKGEYVGIVETDDFIELNMYEELYKLSDGGKIDIIKGNFYHLDDSKPKNSNLRVDESKQDIPSSAFKVFEAPNILNGHPSIWAAIYNRKFLNDNSIRFIEASGGGWVDNPFLFESFFASKSIRYINTPLYYYRESNPDSSSNNLVDLSLPMERMINNLDVFNKYDITNENLIVALYVRIFWHIKDVLSNIDLKNQKNIVYPFIKNIFNRLNVDIIKNRLNKEYVELYEEYIPIVNDCNNQIINVNSPRNNIKISILMPFYNSEDVIEKAILNVIKQSLDDIELICINMESSDSSLDILNKFSQDYDFISIYNFGHINISDALNYGIKISNGDYIAFLDVDDYFVDDDSLEKMYDFASNNELNAVTSNLSQDKSIDISSPINFDIISENKIFPPEEYGIPFALNKNIIKKNFLIYNNIFFTDFGGYDSIFVAELLSKIDKIGAVPTNFYPNTFNNKINYELNREELFDYLNHFKIVFNYLKHIKFKSIRNEYRQLLFWFLKHLSYKKIPDAVNLIKEIFNNDIFLLADLENYLYLKFNNDNIKSNLNINSPLLSIIIPIDKVKSQADKLISSLHNQTFTNFEIVLLTNDGDFSFSLYEKYHANDLIKILFDDYDGFEEMLLEGYKESSGEWCLFFNPNQFVSVNSINTLINNTLTQNSGSFLSKLKLKDFYNGNTLVRNLNSDKYDLNQILESINSNKIKNPKISVIVPVYNAELFLEEALDSVLKQTFDEIELVCVNDGSKDYSLDMLIEFANLDYRFFLIDQVNAGCGAARNKALDYASGDFIYFFDPDDYILPDTFERLYVNAMNNGTDLVMFKIARFVDDEPINYSAPGFDFENVFPNVDFNNFIFDYHDIKRYVMNASFAPWTKLYKKEFLDKYNDFRFPTNIAFDDAPFHIQSVLRASSISFIPEFFYFYRYNPNSIINTSSNGIDIFRICDIVEKFIKENNFYDEFKKEFDLFKIKQIFNYLLSTGTNEYFIKAKEEFSKINLGDDSLLDDDLLYRYNLLLGSNSLTDYLSNYYESKIIKLNDSINKLNDENRVLSSNHERVLKENNELSSNYERVLKENRDLSSKFEISSNRNIVLSDENRKLNVQLRNSLNKKQNQSNIFKKFMSR